MSIRLELLAENAADMRAKLCGMVGRPEILGAFLTDELLDEVRSRLRPEGLTVSIYPVGESAEVALPAPAPGNKKAGRKSQPTVEPVPEQTAPAMQTAILHTREEVIAALNTFSVARGGQVAGRTKMQEVCGTNRLQDVKPEDYPKLLAALAA